MDYEVLTKQDRRWSGKFSHDSPVRGWNRRLGARLQEPAQLVE
jgi:hypothetical protein